MFANTDLECIELILKFSLHHQQITWKMAPTAIQGILQSVEIISSNQNLSSSTGSLHNS